MAWNKGRLLPLEQLYPVIRSEAAARPVGDSVMKPEVHA